MFSPVPFRQRERRQRRLRISTMAAMANPSAQRLDAWHLLDDATNKLAAVDQAGLDTGPDVHRVRRPLARLATYERFWLHPGAARLRRLVAHLDDMDTIALSGQTSLATRLLDEYGDRADLFDDHGSIEDQELAARAARPQFYTVLLP